MQPITADPRGRLTADQVRWLIQGAPAIEVTPGMELIDQDLSLIEDISEDLGGGHVARNSYATLHGTGAFAIRRVLHWPSAIVRPYMTFSDGDITARFNLGAYYTSVPERQSGEIPPTWDVTGFDILHRLADKTGIPYSIPAGTQYGTAVRTILTEQGYSRFIISPLAATKVLTSAYVSPLDDEKTWLSIVNDLLAAMGYAGIWSDWEGRLRCEPYVIPRERSVEWVYDADPDTSILSPQHTTVSDLYEAPNRWVFIRNNDVDGPAPVEGNGIFTYINELVGETSVESRAGRIVTRIERIDAADQEALVNRAWVTIDADLRAPLLIRARTTPNPLHWHFDRIVIDDPSGVVNPWSDVLSTEWSLPLDGSDMEHSWTVL